MNIAPTFFTACGSLPPEEAVSPNGGLSAERVAHFWIIPFVHGTTS